MAKITVKGLDKLEKKLKEDYSMNDVKKLVRFHGSQLQRRMQSKADFRGHFEWKPGKGKVFKKPTGTTKRSIRLEILDGGFTAGVGPGTEYSPYLEYGTRFMDAQPFVKPALDEQSREFINDLRKLMR
jgi:HK97 gp10 family phage protein